MKEKGSYLLKELSTKAEEEEAAERPPPPPPPPVPPPPESKIEDNDLTGYGGAALLIFNGVMTGVKGGMMIEGGLLAGKTTRRTTSYVFDTSFHTFLRDRFCHDQTHRL